MFEWIRKEIRNGVEYPDFWVNRYGEDDPPEEECTYTRSWEQEEKPAAPAPGKSGEQKRKR